MSSDTAFTRAIAYLYFGLAQKLESLSVSPEEEQAILGMTGRWALTPKVGEIEEAGRSTGTSVVLGGPFGPTAM